MVGKAKWFPLHPIQLVILAYAANESGRMAVDCRKFNHSLTCFAITVPDVVMIYGEIKTSSGAYYIAIDLEKAFFSGHVLVMFFRSHTSLASKAGDTLTSPPQRCKWLDPQVIIYFVGSLIHFFPQDFTPLHEIDGIRLIETGEQETAATLPISRCH